MSTVADVLNPTELGEVDHDLEARFEFVNGRIVDRPEMGATADRIATKLIYRLENFVETQGLGQVFGGSCGYRCFSTERLRVRFPDVSFLAKGRLPNEVIPDGHIEIPPDLAVEVISPNDNANNVEERLVDLLEAGTRLMWLLYPSTRHVMIFRQGPNCSRLGPSDSLDGEDVLPGFSCKIADLFPNKTA